jgi:hypothetical protein
MVKNREPRSVRLRASQECVRALKTRKVVLTPPDSEGADRDSLLRWHSAGVKGVSNVPFYQWRYRHHLRCSLR